MWLRLKDGSVVNTDSSLVVGVQQSESGQYKVWIYGPNLGAVPRTVENGYADEKEALAALDELLGGESVVQIQPPVTEEEKAAEEQNPDKEFVTN